MPRYTARQRILTYLQAHAPASAGEIARALGVGAAAARHHLRLLRADGRVRLLEERAAPGQAGRRERLYGLGESLLGGDYAALAQAALQAWLSLLPPEQLSGAAQGLGQTLLPLREALSPQWAFSRKLTVLTETLSGRGYQARWEARSEGPQVILEHCPFVAIVDQQPVLCLMDRLALERGLEVEAQQIARREKNARGKRVCVFRVKV